MRMRSSLAVTAWLLCLAIGRLAAQTPTATLIGDVRDASGAVVTGAKVEVRNSGTNEIRKTESNERGEFTVAKLAAGYYEVTISKEGFRVLTEAGLELQLDQEARMEYHLQVGSLTEKVEVTASAPLINTENAVKGETMVSQEILQMPLDGRSFQDLVSLAPMVVPVEGGGFDSQFASNGQRGDNVNFVIDGFNNRNVRDGTSQAQPNLDAIQEFKVETTGYSAEAGRTAGGLITTVLKGGTNQLHGGLFEFLRNDDMDARNFFAVTKPELRRNDFGGLINGPVVIPKLYNGRNHTFFLFSWETYRQVQGSPSLGVVPTAAARQGNFSAYAPIKDPFATGTYFPNNQIPQSLMSAQALKIQTYYPLPNYPGVNNLNTAVAGPTDWNNPVIKIDQILTSRDSLSFKYLKRYANAVLPYSNGAIYPVDAQTQNGQNTLTGLTYTRTFTPNLVNEARFSVSRSVEYDTGTIMNGVTNYSAEFGLPGPTDPKLFGFPAFNITNYTTLGPAAQMPLQYWVTSYDTSDTMTWAKGAHLIKFGMELLHNDFFRVYDTQSRGAFNFTGSWTTQPYADFLLGLPNNTSMLYGTVKSYLIARNWSGFIQDGWKISSRLTLDLGLRYELPIPLYDMNGRMGSFDPNLGKYVVASLADAPAGTGFKTGSAVETAQQAGLPPALEYTSYKKFAPRFGFAWRPFGGNRTVLRGGYGIYYGTFEFNDILNDFGASFPFVLSVTGNANTTNPNYLTLQNPFPAAPSLVQNVGAGSGTITVYGIQPNPPDPYTQSWNLTMERELGNKSAVEVGYIGSKGTHLSYGDNINQPFRSAATYPNFPVPYPVWGSINYIGFDTNSIYNAASTTFRRRFANNFFYRATYTYSKSIDYASHFAFPAPSAQDPRNLALERGRSDWDRGHVFTMAFSWQAPRNYNIFLRGWQLSGSGIAETGYPFTPTVSNVNLNLGQANRPNRIGKGTVANPSPQEWYDVADFPQVPTNAYTFGTSGRNILDGPGSVSLNTALSRNFAFHETNNLQVRWEMFNFTNHVNFGQPVTTVNTPNAATIIGAGNARSMQVALRYSF